jgi:hypothetical protein
MQKVAFLIEQLQLKIVIEVKRYIEERNRVVVAVRKLYQKRLRPLFQAVDSLDSYIAEQEQQNCKIVEKRSFPRLLNPFSPILPYCDEKFDKSC